jgi:hypothetical protein
MLHETSQASLDIRGLAALPEMLRCYSAAAVEITMLVVPSGSIRKVVTEMARRGSRTTPKYAGVTGAAQKQTERPSIVHTSLYLPEPVYEALRKIAFEERVKIHDVVLEGIDLALRPRGYRSIEGLKAGKKR